MILEAVYFGVRLWILLLFGLSVCMVAGVILYFWREQLIGVWLRFRFPEKVTKVIIHYKTGFYKLYWRVVPDDDIFRIDKKFYLYDGASITKDDDFFVLHNYSVKPMLLVVKNLFTKIIKGKEVFRIGDTEEYDFNKMFMIRGKGSRYPEIHYFYNNPTPINFNIQDKKLEFSATSLKTFQETDLMGKLLRLKNEELMMLLVVVGLLMNIAVSLFTLSKVMGWLK